MHRCSVVENCYDLQYVKCDEKGIEGIECSCENSCNFKTNVIAETCSVIEKNASQFTIKENRKL